MGRYLKSVSMRAFDGTTIKPPLCCISCTKSVCDVPCTEYETKMKDVRCSCFEMEFGMTEVWTKLDILKCVFKCGLYLIFVVMVIVLFKVISNKLPDQYTVSAEKRVFPGITEKCFKVAYQGDGVDTNHLARTIEKAIDGNVRQSQSGDGKHEN